MADAGRETIMSLLCNRKWIWDPRCTCSLTFHENGIGEIIVFDELCPFICAEFDWKPLGTTTSSSLTRPFNPEENDGTHFDIRMTLTKRRIPTIENASTERMQVNEESLKDGAFEPKEHRVRLERGMFMPKEDGNHFFEWHRFRLSMDPSPLPTIEHWKYQPAARALRFWERDTFYAMKVDSSDS